VVAGLDCLPLSVIYDVDVMFEEFFDLGFNFRTIFLAICLIVSIVLLTYYYFKNGHVRLRPRVGEMGLWSLLALMACFGLSGVVGGLLDDPEQLKVDSKLTQGMEEAIQAESQNSAGTGTGNAQGSRIRERQRRADNEREGKRDSNFKF
jgi:hypothetical protein